MRRPVGRIAFTVLAAVMLALGAVRVRAAALVGVVVGLAYVLSWRRADVRTLSTPTQGRLDTPQVATVREWFARVPCPTCGSAGPHWVQVFSGAVTVACTACGSGWATEYVDRPDGGHRN